MRLLVSVTDAAEAHAAVQGGAAIIDAKDPIAGGIHPDALSAIVAAVGGTLPVSAMLGDATNAHDVARASRVVAAARLAYIKIGFAGVPDSTRVEMLLTAAVEGVRTVSASAGVIAVAYADAPRADSVLPLYLIDAAERAGAVGVLLDTAFKDGGSLFDLMDEPSVSYWVRAAHAAGLTAACAGGLRTTDLAIVRALGGDIAGVRGSACIGGRTGRISRERVAALALATGRRRTSTASREEAAFVWDSITSSPSPLPDAEPY